MTFPSNRRFSQAERAALFVAAGGVCTQCGRQLDNTFHADHIKPWSAGGITDVINGQALCPACNLRKGAIL
jgi:5-methylcytosine-specific restriction endonuclease McrA